MIQLVGELARTDTRQPPIICISSVALERFSQFSADWRQIRLSSCFLDIHSLESLRLIKGERLQSKLGRRPGLARGKPQASLLFPHLYLPAVNIKATIKASLRVQHLAQLKLRLSLELDIYLH